MRGSEDWTLIQPKVRGSSCPEHCKVQSGQNVVVFKGFAKNRFKSAQDIAVKLRLPKASTPAAERTKLFV
jgi:hypothetical protein